MTDKQVGTGPGTEPLHTVIEDPLEIARIAIGTFVGRYRVLGELGEGSNAIVYLADDRVKNRQVAIKIPRSRAPMAIERFWQETNTASQCQHPNVVPILEVDSLGDGTPFAVMPHYERGSLANLIEKGPIATRHAIALVSKLCEAAAYLHSQQRIVHRDLKPQNILIDGKGAPLLADFGLAIHKDSPRRVAIAGTRQYISPEQVNSGQVDGRADVWSIGVILYQLLTGRLPFSGDDVLAQVFSHDPEPPRQINPQIPKRLESVCLKCLDKETTRRYATALDVAIDLKAVRRAQLIPRIAAFIAIATVAVSLVGWVFWSPTRSSPLSSADAIQDLPSARLLAELGAGSPAAAVGEWVLPKLTLDLLGKRTGWNEFRPLKDGDELASQEDDYLVVAKPLTPGYLYIFQVDSRGNATWLFPRNDRVPYSTGTNPVTPGLLVQLPPPDQQSALYLDENTGVEHVYAVFSATTWPAIEQILSDRSIPTKDTTGLQTKIEEPFRLLTRGVGGARKSPLVSGAPIDLTISGKTVTGELQLTIKSVPWEARETSMVIERWIRHVDARNP